MALYISYKTMTNSFTLPTHIKKTIKYDKVYEFVLKNNKIHFN